MKQERKCPVLAIGTVHLKHTGITRLHFMSFLECIFFLIVMSQDRNLATFCHISEALCASRTSDATVVVFSLLKV